MKSQIQSRRLHLVYLVLCAAFVFTNPAALQVSLGAAPTREEFLAASRTLRDVAMQVEGTITVWLVESVLPGQLEELDLKDKCAPDLTGELWRSGDLFRVDYRRNDGPVSATGGSRWLRGSTAATADTVFQVTEETTIEGLLHVYPRQSKGGQDVVDWIDGKFLRAIDAGWRPGGNEVSSLLNQSGVQFVNTGCTERPGTFSLRESLRGGADSACFSFRDSTPFPVEMVKGASSAGSLRAVIDIAVTWKEVPGGMLPLRVVERSDIGNSRGYTTIVDLDLTHRTSADTPARLTGLTVDSFKELGFGFTVYRQLNDGTFTGDLNGQPLTNAASEPNGDSEMWTVCGLMSLIGIVLVFAWCRYVTAGSPEVAQ